jgi:hypothetical protein
LQGDFSGCACWVVDFKTGSAQSLSEKKIGEGKGLQPLLYALAVRARGAALDGDFAAYLAMRR